MRTFARLPVQAAPLGALVFGLLAACDPAAPIPTCGSGEAIAYDDGGQPVCRRLADLTRLALPACKDGESLTVEGTSVLCTPSVDVADPAAVTGPLQAIEQAVAQADAERTENLPQRGALFVGLTPQTTNGAMSANGFFGARASHELCAIHYGESAYMCTAYTLHLSASLGLLTAASLPRAWVYFPAWNTSATITGPANTGRDDNCRDFTYPTTSYGYRGVNVQWGALPTGPSGLLLPSGNDAYCTNSLPVACCR